MYISYNAQDLLLNKLNEGRKYFFDNGYIIIDNVIEPLLIYNVNNSIKEFTERKHNLFLHNSFVKQIAYNVTIYHILHAFYNDTPSIFQTINFNYGTQQEEHTDLIFFRPDTSKLQYMCGVWCALEDISSEKGPLIFYPKSHKEKYIISLEQFGSMENYTKYIKTRATQKYNRVSANIKKGSIVIWHSNLIHGGHPHRDEKLTRKSMVTHYFFKSAPYILSPYDEFNRKHINSTQ